MLCRYNRDMQSPSLRSIRRWTLLAAVVAILAACTSPLQDEAKIKSEKERWTPVVKHAGIQPN